MFHFSNSLFVGPDLDPLMLFVRGSKALLAIGGSYWAENSHIEKRYILHARNFLEKGLLSDYPRRYNREGNAYQYAIKRYG